MNLDRTERTIEILDTTLRDGSYANNFQFTAGQTRALCRNLEEAGIRLIEVGHGIGLNAGTSGYEEAIATDKAYMEAASEACDEADWGMFCVPGIATLGDLELAAEKGMGFIRIGTNVTEVEESKPFIEFAKNQGMFVTANYMKSYARPPEVFAEKTRLSEEYGADMIYLVDSAGGMLPDTVRDYYRASRKVSDVPIGFHGHDNLGLAVANSLVMAEEGAVVIDTSLQGLGRSAGNASTEKTVAVLEKWGHQTGTDLLRLLRVGQRYVNPIRSNPAQMPLDVVSGQVEFHSSYMPKIIDAAYKYDVDPARLIRAVSERDKIYASEQLVEDAAKELEGPGDGRPADYGFSSYPGEEENEYRH